MQLASLEQYLPGLFTTKDNPIFPEESGVTVRGAESIKKIGYCTNLTLPTIEQAHQKGVDLMLTHHDAWHFIFGLKDACHQKLMEYGISHYFNHLPLDDCDFGTNNTLAAKLGLRIINRTHEEEGFYCGRVAEFPERTALKDIVQKLAALLEEPVRGWDFRGGKIKRVGLVCGAGGYSPDVKKAVELGCELYITGESNLYTIEYAQFAKVNLIIASHTFTEIFGIESLAQKVKTSFPEIEIVRLQEEHLETMGWGERR